MPPKMLVVDDTEHIHALIRVFFLDEVVELHSSYSGPDGIAAAESIIPDLILLDVDMPKMDGFEACRRLRENPFTMHIPVIFLTAESENRKIVQGLESGASDYITKPFNANVLIARVRAALRTKARMDLLANRRVKTFMSNAATVTTKS